MSTRGIPRVVIACDFAERAANTAGQASSGTQAVPDAVVCHGTVTYTRHNGTQLRVPFANVFKLKNKRIQDYLIYIDNTRLYAEP